MTIEDDDMKKIRYLKEMYPQWCEGVRITFDNRINRENVHSCKLGPYMAFTNRIIEAAKRIVTESLSDAKPLQVGEKLMDVLFYEVFLLLFSSL